MSRDGTDADGVSKTYIEIYDTYKGLHNVIYTHYQQINCVAASVNAERTLLGMLYTGKSASI